MKKSIVRRVIALVYRGLMQSNNVGMAAAAGVYQSAIEFCPSCLSILLCRRILSKG